jgi:hypothetical protein
MLSKVGVVLVLTVLGGTAGLLVAKAPLAQWRNATAANRAVDCCTPCDACEPCDDCCPDCPVCCGK